ncbi:MAG: ChbG/HpnK family deacetylase [Planctomycetes bacterium]|nr:ChbG/HpnK family deacetylase [Planctomycetota bacterium]
MAAVPPPRLIVNADDLGFSEGVDRAIFAGHDRGIVTSASLMATGASFEHAVRGAFERPRLGVGVHLVLHDDLPVSEPRAVPSLVGPAGRFRPLREAVRALLFGRVDEREVELEYAAQIQRVLAAGVTPTHLDSHCHLHALPSVGPIVHRLGERFGIACAREPEASSWSDFRAAPLGRYPLALLISASQRFTRRRIVNGLRAPDRFLGLVKSGALDEDWLVRAIEALEPGRITELMVHPGDDEQAFAGVADHGAAVRRRELEAITAPRVLEAVRRCGVELVDYRALLT